MLALWLADKVNWWMNSNVFALLTDSSPNLVLVYFINYFASLA